MISTVPTLFQDERKQDTDNYVQNMHNMQTLLLSKLLEHTNKKKNKKDKGKKTKGKSITITPRVRANLRQRLLLQQQARPPTSYAQPYVPQQEMKLQQAKDQAAVANSQLVNYQAAIQQQHEEARKSKAALKEAKAKAKAEEKRAVEAERHNAELEKQQAAYEDARTRYQKAMHEGELGELEMENASLLSKVKMLEFATNDRKAKIAQNKMAHSNEVLQTEVDSLTAERDALDALLQSDVYGDSVNVQTKLVKKQKELELQRDLKKKQLEQLTKNHELKIQLDSYPSAFKIKSLNAAYDKQIALAIVEQGKLNSDIAKKEDDLYKVETKRNIWRESVRKKETASADLARLTQEEASSTSPTTSEIDTINTEIANLNIQLDAIHDSIDNAKSVKGRYNKLVSKRNELTDDLTRESAKSIAYAFNTAPLVNAITNVAKTIGTQEAHLEDIKNDQEPYLLARKQLSALGSRLSATKNDTEIETAKYNALFDRKETDLENIKKALSNVGAAEVALAQSKDLTKAQMDKNKASDSLSIEEGKRTAMASEEWLETSRRIIETRQNIQKYEELKRNQEALNKATKQHTEDTILSRFFQTCADNDFNLDLHAHEVDSNLLQQAGIDKPEDQATVLNSIASLRKSASDFAIERTRVATEATSILDSMNLSRDYTRDASVNDYVNIVDPPEVTREQFHQGVAAFREYTGVPNAFNDIYHDAD